MNKRLGDPTPTKDRASVHTSRLSSCNEMSTEPSNLRKNSRCHPTSARYKELSQNNADVDCSHLLNRWALTRCIRSQIVDNG